MDGVWLEWNHWGECDPVRCMKLRERACDGPYHGGQPCPPAPETGFGEVGAAGFDDCRRWGTTATKCAKGKTDASVLF